jgi:quercetin dioxygenase-like cupin family protein
MLIDEVKMTASAVPDPVPPISRDIVLDAHLEQATDTRRIEVRRIQMVPGYAAGLHVHNGPVVGSIVSGSVSFQVEGEPETVLGPGDVFFEPEGARIARFDARDDGVTFLAYFLLGPGQESAISFPDA